MDVFDVFDILDVVDDMDVAVTNIIVMVIINNIGKLRGKSQSGIPDMIFLEARHAGHVDVFKLTCTVSLLLFITLAGL